MISNAASWSNANTTCFKASSVTSSSTMRTMSSMRPSIMPISTTNAERQLGNPFNLLYVLRSHSVSLVYQEDQEWLSSYWRVSYLSPSHHLHRLHLSRRLSPRKARLRAHRMVWEPFYRSCRSQWGRARASQSLQHVGRWPCLHRWRNHQKDWGSRGVHSASERKTAVVLGGWGGVSKERWSR